MQPSGLIGVTVLYDHVDYWLPTCNWHSRKHCKMRTQVDKVIGAANAVYMHNIPSFAPSVLVTAVVATRPVSSLEMVSQRIKRLLIFWSPPRIELLKF